MILSQIKAPSPLSLSSNLLNIAKLGVELAIEKDEQQAQMWMDSELKKLSVK